jgi:predicted RNA-binding protein
MFDKLEMAENRYEEINQKLSYPSVIANQDEYRKLMKEYSELGEIVQKFREYKRANKDIADALELLNDKIDKDFREMVQAELDEAKERLEAINKEITKIYIGAGKKKKIRAGDIVGAITSIQGVKSEDIGIIDVQDNYSYEDIMNEKGELVLQELGQVTIKGKIIKVERAEK